MIDSIHVQHCERIPYYLVTGLPTRLAAKVNSFFELWLLRNFSKRTVRAYAYDLVVFLRFYRGKKRVFPPFENVNVKTLIEFIQQEKGRNASPRSINRRVNTIDVFYRHCFNKLIPGTRAINSNPTEMRGRRYLTMDSTLGIFPVYSKSHRTLRLRVPHELIRTLEPDEVKAFLATLKTHRDRAIVSLMLICGLRSMELLNLRLEDINILDKTLKIHGKGNKERFVPLSDDILACLERYIEVERPVLRGRERETAVFLTMKGPKRGLPMCLEGLRALFRYKRAISGVTHANPHRFRHTFGRNMAVAGMTLPALQKILGHNDHRTTVRYINLVMKDVFEDFEKASEAQRDLYGKTLQGS